MSWRPGLIFALLTLLPITAPAQAPTRPAHDTPPVLTTPPAKPHHPPPARSAKAARKAAHAVTAAVPPKAATAKHETPVEAKPPPPPIDPSKGSVTGLELPRFAALRADEVNLRAGPGRRYPIEWLYKRRGMPVEIEREFEVWRLITAPDGTKGWVHEATLVGRRDFIVTGTERTMRTGPAETARAVAILKPGVVGRIRSCAAGAAWCKVQVGDYSGWLARDAFWGALPNEVVAPG